MRRRAFLLAVGAGGLAGCSAPMASDSPSREVVTGPLGRHGSPPTICEETPTPGAIDAIVDPVFAGDWADVDVADRYRRRGEFTDGSTVIGIAGGTGSRAYPLSILWFHEVVNDTVDVPVLITYCPLCRSGLVADRRLDGTASTFDATGLLWRAPGIEAAAAERSGRVFGARWGANSSETTVRNAGNLVMADSETGSYWSQILATAICGLLAGEELTIVPSTLTTWGEWRDSQPDARILPPPPYSGTV